LHARVHSQRARYADTSRVEDSASGRALPVHDVTTAMLRAAMPLDIALAYGTGEKNLTGERLVQQTDLFRRRVELVAARAGPLSPVSPMVPRGEIGTASGSWNRK